MVGTIAGASVATAGSLSGSRALQASQSAQQVVVPSPALWNDIVITVNGVAQNLKVRANWTLNTVLRETLGLTGTKVACNNSSCGACTVLLDGNPVYSCSRLAVEVSGHKITTIEGIPNPTTGELHPVQQAFIAYGAAQCGYCTPGFIMNAVALLTANPNPTQDQVVKALSGNLCRCGTYVHILQAMAALSSSGEGVPG